MKLLQLNVTANWGSTGKIAEGIGQAAMARGWESAIAYGRYSNPSSSLCVKVGNKKDVYLHYLRNRLFDQEGLGSKNATRRLINWIDLYKPDIIHLHNIHDHWLNYPILFNYLATIDTPVFWTFHDCWAFTGGCAYFDEINCYKWREKCDCCPYKKFNIDKSFRHFSLRQTAFKQIKNRLYLVPVSNWLADYVKQSFLADYNCTVINNGIDINAFNINYRIFSKYVLGVALPWSKRKGMDDIIRLSDILPSDIEIRLVGLTDKQIKSLPPRIIGIKKTQNIKALAELYSGAKAFINPTYADNFPTVNLEALACGTPVITYRTGGSPEAIDENTGIVVEKGDIGGLASAVMKLLNNPDKYSTEACRKRAVEHFNKDIQFGRYINLYEEILSKSR